MIEAFIDFMDGIYWIGYAEKLSVDDPGKFTFELSEFLEKYA